MVSSGTPSVAMVEAAASVRFSSFRRWRARIRASKIGLTDVPEPGMQRDRHQRGAVQEGVPTNAIREYTVKRHRGEPGHTKDVILGATNGVSPDPCDMTASGTSKTFRTHTPPGRRDPFQQTLEADPAPSPSARPVSARTPTRINHAT